MTARKQHDAHMRDLRELRKQVERARREAAAQSERARRARYRCEDNNHDGRPAVDKLPHRSDDPLLAALREGKR